MADPSQTLPSFLSQADRDALGGTSYRSDFRFAPGIPSTVETRFEVVADLCRDRTVVHLGFADHNPETIARKRKEGRWFHDALAAAARRCAGVDIDEETTRFASESLGIPDLHSLDILTGDLSVLGEQCWDYLVLGELVEHLDNPVAFLGCLAERFRGRANRCVLTTPNAYYYRNLRTPSLGFEGINSDHRYWFTPYTLCKVAVRAGLEPVELRITEDFKKPRFPAPAWFRSRFRPWSRPKLVLVAAISR